MESSKFDVHRAIVPASDVAHTLTEVERSALEAAVSRVLPSSDGVGAREADVMAFIDWIIKQPCFDQGRQRFIVGLRLLETSAEIRYGAPFHACSAADQDDLLAGLATIPHATVRHFFATLVRLAVLGFLSPAGYPGNRGDVGFRYMGYVGAPTVR